MIQLVLPPLLAALVWLMFSFTSKKWNPKGLHVYITGGSQGLGLATALNLAKRGAHVSVVARNQERLDEALKQLEAVRQNEAQIFKTYSFSLYEAESSEEALKAACVPFGGRAPDAIFTCAGGSRPKFIVDMTPEDMKRGMDDAFWVQAWTAFAATKMFVRQKKRDGKIILVASTLGYFSFIGWASYAPGKYALRGLADTLVSELQLYGNSVHIYMAGTMYTTGFDEENRTKPAITRKIEGGDEGLTAEQAATAMLKGVEKGYEHISPNLITDIFRASTRGATAKNNIIYDVILDIIGFIGIPIFRWGADGDVRKHRAEHETYLQAKGFYEDVDNKQ